MYSSTSHVKGLTQFCSGRRHRQIQNSLKPKGYGKLFLKLKLTAEFVQVY